MSTVPEPKFKIQYNGKDITAALTKYLISISYTDKIIGESDELEIQLEDTEALWRNSWYPVKGDKLHLKMGYDDLILDCGDFRIDEIELNGPPDTVTIRALASWTTSAMRTKCSKAYESQTLRQIAASVAAKHGLTVDDGSTDKSKKSTIDISKEKSSLIYEAKFLQGIQNGTDGTIGGALEGSGITLKQVSESLKLKGFTSEAAEVLVASEKFIAAAVSGDRAERLKQIQLQCPILIKISDSLKPKVTVKAGAYNGVLYTLRIDRSTQNDETDLGYLKRLCDEYGFIFSIQGTKLIFQSIFDIEAGLPVLTISRTDLISYTLKDKTSLTYKDCKVQSHNPTTRKTITSTISEVKNADGVTFNEITSADTLVIKSKSENKQQAEHKAKVSLYKSKTQQVEGTLTLPGNPMLVAGNNFLLEDMGQFSGKYHIMKSGHAGDKDGGYVTNIDVKRVGYVQLKRHKLAKKKKPVKYDVAVIK